MAVIKNLIFDMGGVLIRFDRHYFISKLGISGEDEEILLRNVFLSLEWAAMDRGTIDEQGAFENIRRRIPAHLHDAAWKLLTMWERPILPLPGMEALIREMKEKGLHLFLLSNASVRQRDYWPLVPAHECFEDTLISSDVRVVKPQPEIYRLAMVKFGVRPEETAFIDDSAWNAEAACECGMHGFVFHGDADELREWLKDHGVR